MIGRRVRRATTALCVLLLAACGTSPPASSVGPTLPSSAVPTSTPSTTSAAAPTTTAAPDPVQIRLDALSDAQKVGQLFVVGGTASGVEPATLAAVTTYHVGSVMLRGRSDLGTAATATVSAQLQALTTAAATGDVGLYVATDQEGGLVQVLSGPGFSTIPDGPDQATLSVAAMTSSAAGWAAELVAAGVNLNLAPVLDLVPPGQTASNPPIGALRRNLGSDPADVAALGAAYVTGMQGAGVSCTVKHFPGLGRVSANTDVSSGVIDTMTSGSPAQLAPFVAGIGAGARLVMVSLATYELIDPTQPAVFSPTVISTVLRGQLGYDGLVITDDVGSATQVAAYPPGERATRFIAAGGDLVLTVDPDLVPQMTEAVLARMTADPAFAAQVDAAVRRVLSAKKEQGLW